MPLPSPPEVLQLHQESLPEWLSHAEPPQLNQATIASFRASRVVFYPGSGTDGHDLRLFGSAHAAHCFVHCDHIVSLDQVVASLQGGLLPDYVVENLHVLDEGQTNELLGPVLPPPAILQEYPGWPESQLKGAVWAVLRNDNGHGTPSPRRLAFLHVRADAFWTYARVFGTRNPRSERYERGKHAKPAYAVVLEDYGFGANWHRFSGEDSLLLQLANEAGLPEWLLVGENGNTEAWPGYRQASDLEPRGMPDCPRALWRRASGDSTG